jgi:alpha-amylase
MNASDDNSAREVMWKSGYKITTLYQYLAVLNRVRKVSWNVGFGSNLTTSIYAEPNFAVVQKGPLLMVLSNEGSESTPRKISIHTAFPTGSVLVNVLTGESIAVKHSTSMTIVQGQPQIYVPYQLASQVCSNIKPPPPPTNLAAKLFYRLFTPKTDSSISSWSNDLPVNTNNILQPSLQDVSSGQILPPPPASLSSPYSIFCATS